MRFRHCAQFLRVYGAVLEKHQRRYAADAEFLRRIRVLVDIEFDDRKFVSVFTGCLVEQGRDAEAERVLAGSGATAAQVAATGELP